MRLRGRRAETFEPKKNTSDCDASYSSRSTIKPAGESQKLYRTGSSPVMVTLFYAANQIHSDVKLDKAIHRGRQHLEDALDEYNPSAIFAGFSGGTDSLMAAHVLHHLRNDVSALHINTGIGMKRTRQYVRDTCDELGWDLEEVHAKHDAGQDYDEIVRGNTNLPGGFPGPPMHAPGPPMYNAIYRVLKERPLRVAWRRHKKKRGDKIALVTGIRADESDKRMGYDEQVDVVGGVVWINLIYYVSAHQKQKYISTHGLKTNPVSDVYGMSGECICGAFDEDGNRLCELKNACYRFGEPETYERIVSLHEEVKERYPWNWDERRPPWFDEATKGQLSIEGLPGADEANQVARMCVGCGKGTGKQRT